MMLDGDVFVFDNVVHMYDLSDDNLKQPDNALDRHWHLAIGVARRPKGQDKAAGITDGYAAFARRWTFADLGKMLFADSSTDMAMAQAVRQKLMPVAGVTDVTVEGVRLSAAALKRAEQMYAGYAPWVG